MTASATGSTTITLQPRNCVDNRGPDWTLAVRVCVAVIADEMEPEECRKAFLAAAMEEGMLFPD
ncbi:DUF982 domain-containing protein [Mesorhizobium sp. M1272]|uniref:DUF982 domain-containing protein n=1 Tax=Mesorhizobium sp. M1272 TaxID=2957074 RepID=UPI00333948E0